MHSNELFLYDIIVESARAQLVAQNDDGSMPPGINGPWRDMDTPVRNTAHWALLLYKAYDISKESIFLKAALSACDYLKSEKTRPYKASFLCLLTKDRPPENGLIGQAWAIEPLIFIGRELKRRDYLEIAEEVLLKHNYEPTLHLWYNLNIDGEVGMINPTFNQQLWFATMNLILGKEINNKILILRARDFFNNLTKNLIFLEPGLIRHCLPIYAIYTNSIYKWRKFIEVKFFNMPEYKSFNLEVLYNRSIGYLPFNLYVLALGYSNIPNENWWKNKHLINIISRILAYVQDEKFINKSFINQYAWSYNPFGFEIAYALYIFQNLTNNIRPLDALKSWVELQLQKHWDLSSNLMDQNSFDPKTLAARLYEVIRLPNFKLSINNEELKNVPGPN